MLEYLVNGAQLGWLIDPQKRQVQVYRPATTTADAPTIEILDDPEMISGDPVLPGFALTLAEVWNAGV